MRRLIVTVLAVAALAFAGISPAFATKPSPDHQVWVCKYVGQPGDFETLKSGKNPIIVDVAAADAYVGADFADGQTHSYVIDLATDENTGQGERYTGDQTCPTPTPTPRRRPVTPTPTPSASPTTTPTSTPSPTPTSSVTTTATPMPKMTLPPTDTSGTPDDVGQVGLLYGVLAAVGILALIEAMVISNRKKR